MLTRLLLLLSMLVATAYAPAGDGEIWLLVDTRARTLTVFQGDTELRVYENISIGSGGITTDKRKDDEKTPLGEYRIARIATRTPFHRFFGFNYPTAEQAQRAVLAGVIDERQYRRIRAAARRGEVPPGDTPLGGYLGIHGIGAGDPRIHADFNWTNGCIALSNEEIDDMASWIEIGTRVKVQ